MLTRDENGFPILLDQESSNVVTPEKPVENNADPTETARRNDAVREVARRYKHGDQDSVNKYLEQRITRPLTVDELDSFHKDVHQHRVSDLIDIIDHQLRGSGVLTRSYRAVKVSAPSGWVESMLDTLDDDEVILIARRLKHRGHDLTDVQKFLGKRIKKEKFAKLSDKLDDDTYELNLSSSGLVEGTFNEGEQASNGHSLDNISEAIGRGIAVALKELKE
jgi:hypothetical protein